MVIYWRVGNCLKIESQNSGLILDPASAQNATKPVKLDGDAVVFMSAEEKNKLSASKETFFSIYNPGEYDVKDFFIITLNNSKDKPIHVLETEGMRLCHLSEASQKELSDEQLSAIGTIDILFISVDGVIDSETAAKLVNEIEPRIVIPIGYEGDKPSLFLKEMGGVAEEPQNKVNVKRKDLPQEETKIILLNVTK